MGQAGGSLYHSLYFCFLYNHSLYIFIYIKFKVLFFKKHFFILHLDRVIYAHFPGTQILTEIALLTIFNGILQRIKYCHHWTNNVKMNIQALQDVEMTPANSPMAEGQWHEGLRFHHQSITGSRLCSFILDPRSFSTRPFCQQSPASQLLNIWSWYEADMLVCCSVVYTSIHLPISNSSPFLTTHVQAILSVFEFAF